jgi:metal-sulfur cluster biosynthetic enzyme
MIDPNLEPALRRVVDPCSMAAKVPLDIVDMGLVRTAVLTSGRAVIHLIVTSPHCMQIGTIVDAARTALLALPVVDRVEIEVDPLDLWEETRMSPSARQRLAERRARTRQLLESERVGREGRQLTV